MTRCNRSILFAIVLIVCLMGTNECFFFKSKTKTSTTTTTSSTTTTVTTPSTTTTIPTTTTTKTTTTTVTIPNLKIAKGRVTPVYDKDSYYVYRILDGDTIVVRQGSSRKDITVRFKCVDAPEKTQDPWGQISLKALSDITPINSKVNLINTSGDQYGRVLAEVINNKGINANKQMLELGMVVHYPFQSGCKEYQDIERIAKRKNVGVWKSNSFELPWDYRRRVGIGNYGTSTTNSNQPTRSKPRNYN